MGEKAIWDESDEEPVSRFGKGTRRKILFGAATTSLLVMVGIAVATTVLIFTQTIPGATQPAGMSTVCPEADLVQSGALVANGSGGNFAAIFTCDTGPAFTVTSQASLTVSVVPSAGVTGVYILPNGVIPSSSGCAGTNGAAKIVSGPASPGVGQWEYCVDASATFGAFAVSWSQ